MVLPDNPVNLEPNLGSILFFVSSGRILYAVAIPMAISNAVGGAIGTRLARVKGNRFIRIFFLIVVTGTIVRFAYDVFLCDFVTELLWWDGALLRRSVKIVMSYGRTSTFQRSNVSTILRPIANPQVLF